MAAEDVGSGSEVEELSDAEKARVGAHFMMSAPPGQLDAITADVRTIVPESALDEGKVDAVYARYNVEHLVSVELPGGRRMVLAKEGAAGTVTNFIDSVGRKVYGVNHRTRTVNADDVRDLAEDEFDASIEEQRAALAETMVAYATLFFGDTGAADVYGKDGKLEVVMSGQSSNERNKWSGSWRSWWTVDVAGKTISGKVRIVTHYYENGNMQLHSQKEFEPKPLTFEDAASLAKAVRAEVAEAERTVQQGIGMMAAQMGTTTLKDVRRMLPVSGKAMDWNVHAHRMRANLVAKS